MATVEAHSNALPRKRWRKKPKLPAPVSGHVNHPSALPPPPMRDSPSLETPSAVPQLPLSSSVTFKSFFDQGLISQVLLHAIPFDTCSEVQALTLGPVLSGDDILARAKTGTGKTLAFLVPCIQHLSLQTTPPASRTSVLILSPTRELALQIAKDAENLVIRSGLPYGVQCLIGGTNINAEVGALKRSRADILIATPGRLKDHLENYGLAPKLGQLTTLIFDEADRLLDAGFKADIDRILGLLPDRASQPRQTLMFSATISEDVKKIVTRALKPNHQFISTVSEDEQATHEHVAQEYILAPMPNTLPLVAFILAQEAKDPNAKVIAFLTTAVQTALISALFKNLIPEFPVFEIHSRKSQSARTSAMSAFKNSPNGVLFSSDVTARGIDIPNITCVLQIGIPQSTETYIHRLGRTARAGQAGKGLLIFSAEEHRAFMHHAEARELPLSTHTLSTESTQQLAFSTWQTPIASALSNVEDDIKAKSYQGWMGYYKAFARALGWSERDLCVKAKSYALSDLGYIGKGDDKPPPLLAKTLGMMGIKPPSRTNLIQEGLLAIAPPESKPGGRGGGRGGGPARLGGHAIAEVEERNDQGTEGGGRQASRGRGRGGGRRGGRGGRPKPNQEASTSW